MAELNERRTRSTQFWTRELWIVFVILASSFVERYQVSGTNLPLETALTTARHACYTCTDCDNPSNSLTCPTNLSRCLTLLIVRNGNVKLKMQISRVCTYQTVGCNSLPHGMFACVCAGFNCNAGDASEVLSRAVQGGYRPGDTQAPITQSPTTRITYRPPGYLWGDGNNGLLITPIYTTASTPGYVTSCYDCRLCNIAHNSRSCPAGITRCREMLISDRGYLKIHRECAPKADEPLGCRLVGSQVYSCVCDRLNCNSHSLDELFAQAWPLGLSTSTRPVTQPIWPPQTTTITSVTISCYTSRDCIEVSECPPTQCKYGTDRCQQVLYKLNGHHTVDRRCVSNTEPGTVGCRLSDGGSKYQCICKGNLCNKETMFKLLDLATKNGYSWGNGNNGLLTTPIYTTANTPGSVTSCYDCRLCNIAHNSRSCPAGITRCREMLISDRGYLKVHRLCALKADEPLGCRLYDNVYMCVCDSLNCNSHSLDELYALAGPLGLTTSTGQVTQPIWPPQTTTIAPVTISCYNSKDCIEVSQCRPTQCKYGTDRCQQVLYKLDGHHTVDRRCVSNTEPGTVGCRLSDGGSKYQCICKGNLCNKETMFELLDLATKNGYLWGNGNNGLLTTPIYTTANTPGSVTSCYDCRLCNIAHNSRSCPAGITRCREMLISDRGYLKVHRLCALKADEPLGCRLYDNVYMCVCDSLNCNSHSLDELYALAGPLGLTTSTGQVTQPIWPSSATTGATTSSCFMCTHGFCMNQGFLDGVPYDSQPCGAGVTRCREYLAYNYRTLGVLRGCLSANEPVGCKLSDDRRSYECVCDGHNCNFHSPDELIDQAKRDGLIIRTEPIVEPPQPPPPSRPTPFVEPPPRPTTTSISDPYTTTGPIVGFSHTCHQCEVCDTPTSFIQNCPIGYGMCATAYKSFAGRYIVSRFCASSSIKVGCVAFSVNMFACTCSDPNCNTMTRPAIVDKSIAGGFVTTSPSPELLLRTCYVCSGTVEECDHRPGMHSEICRMADQNYCQVSISVLENRKQWKLIRGCATKSAIRPGPPQLCYQKNMGISCPCGPNMPKCNVYTAQEMIEFAAKYNIAEVNPDKSTTTATTTTHSRSTAISVVHTTPSYGHSTPVTHDRSTVRPQPSTTVMVTLSSRPITRVTTCWSCNASDPSCAYPNEKVFRDAGYSKKCRSRADDHSPFCVALMVDATKRNVHRQCMGIIDSPIDNKDGCFRFTNNPNYPKGFACVCHTDECNLIDADKMMEQYKDHGDDWQPKQPPWFPENYIHTLTSLMPPPPPSMAPPRAHLRCWTCRGHGDSCDYPNREVYDQLYLGPADGCAPVPEGPLYCVSILHADKVTVQRKCGERKFVPGCRSFEDKFVCACDKLFCNLVSVDEMNRLAATNGTHRDPLPPIWYETPNRTKPQPPPPPPRPSLRPVTSWSDYPNFSVEPSQPSYTTSRPGNITTWWQERLRHLSGWLTVTFF